MLSLDSYLSQTRRNSGVSEAKHATTLTKSISYIQSVLRRLPPRRGGVPHRSGFSSYEGAPAAPGVERHRTAEIRNSLALMLFSVADATRKAASDTDNIQRHSHCPYKRNSLRECYLKSPHPSPPLEGRGCGGNLQALQIICRVRRAAL